MDDRAHAGWQVQSNVICFKSMKSLPVLDPKAAAIDVGSEKLHVSIAGDVPKVFGTFTGDLENLRAYFKEQQVRSVAMEATGVYWLYLYEVLEGAGLEVIVVNGRHVQNVPGRKTDMADCQWLATLHAHGLLRGGFVPPAEIRRLQDYQRLREDHIRGAASQVQKMQQALERMNVKFHDVISDLTGVSGLKVVGAILRGERDSAKLLELCDQQIQKKKSAAVVESLRGCWKEEHLFALRQALELWEFFQQKIAQCDRELEKLLHQLVPPSSNDSADGGTSKLARAKVPGKNAPVIAKFQQLLARIRQFDAIEGWYRQGAMSCAHWLTWRIGLDRGAAREKPTPPEELSGCFSSEGHCSRRSPHPRRGRRAGRPCWCWPSRRRPAGTARTGCST